MPKRTRARAASSKSGIRAKKSAGGGLLKDGTVRESIIQARIMRWLKTTGLLFWRSNSGSLFLHGRHINLGPLGCADISLVLPVHGTFVGMEVKSANGRIRKDQLEYSKVLTAMGGKYFIVRSVEDAQNAVAQCLGEQQWNLLCDKKSEPLPLRPQHLRSLGSLRRRLAGK